MDSLIRGSVYPREEEEMEIKTIEELACIPVENDDFAAASDQDEGDVILRPSLNYWQDAWRRLRKNPVAILAIVMLAALAVMCVVGPGMTGYDYDAVSLSEKNALPSSDHWFGTDKMGRDLFTRVWIGGRISMILGIAGAAIDMLIGVVYGGVAAYFGGKTDAIMMRIVEILASIPYLLLVVLVSLIVGKGVGSLLIAMCLTGWCHMARLVRGQVLQLKDQEYLLAAKALGTPWYKVIFRHLIPNTLGVVIVAVTFDVPSFIFGEAFLSYIGLGVQAPMTSWGSLASNAQQTMAFYPYQLFFPAFFIALTMLSFQLLGDGLRDALDPKLRQ
ncbi:ABC transporter permease [Lachnospiraceae bacterium BX10]|uniref:ABC transporter permease n=2 Tax=Enterocloster hominis (ex Liu et al. 2021) TaxID=2763663 RepID=A0ABR7NTJ4_9FIRM|nr:ABC transporter permease [Enterocloster hominis]